MAVYSCWYIFRTMSALDSPCYLSRFSSRCLLPSALWLLSVFRFSNFPILLATFASLCFICSVEFPFGGSSPVLHYFLYAPPSFFRLPGDIYHDACSAFILFRLLLWPERICAAGGVATPIKSSNIQIAQWNVNYALCASTRTKSDSRTHTQTHKHTDRYTHSYTYPSRSLCHPQLIPLLFAPINLVA